MRIGVLTDTNSGISKEKAKELGIHVIAMPFQVDQITYLEGGELGYNDIFTALDENKEVGTSQVSPGMNMDEWDQLLLTYDAIIHIPMSSALSSTFQTAKQMSIIEDKYIDKIFVVDNKRVSITLEHSCLVAKKLVELGKSPQEILEFLESDSLNAEIYLSVDTVKYLKKSGRLSPAAATVAGLLGIKPVLKVTDGKIESYKKVRSNAQAKKELISVLKEKVDSNTKVYAVYTGEESVGKEWKKEIEGVLGVEVELRTLPLSISIHTGPNTLAVGFVKEPTI